MIALTILGYTVFVLSVLDSTRVLDVQRSFPFVEPTLRFILATKEQVGIFASPRTSDSRSLVGDEGLESERGGRGIDNVCIIVPTSEMSPRGDFESYECNSASNTRIFYI